VRRPENKTVIGNRIFLHNKSRWVSPEKESMSDAQSCLTKARVSFQKETFLLVARLSSVRIIVAAAIKLNMKIRQFDVSITHLNGDFQEKMYSYMEPLRHLKLRLKHICQKKTIDHNFQQTVKKILKELKSGNWVCILKKALYGQIGRACSRKLNVIFKEIRTQLLNSDPCVYKIKRNEANAFLVYLCRRHFRRV